MKIRRKDGRIVLLGLGIVFLLIVLGSHYLENSREKPQLPAASAQITILNGTEAEIYLPAVDNQGKGVVTLLKVEALPGKGRVLVNVNNLLFWVDTQQSIQNAKEVAEKFTGLNLSNYDLVYDIQTNATVVEGPSAGAAIAIATIAALEGKQLPKDVMITGTIETDGSIGPVGGIIPKAKAAKDIGAKLFLVPQGQGTEKNYVPQQKCEQTGSFTFCITTYKEVTESVGKAVGIEVKEVSNISEAMKYFFG